MYIYVFVYIHIRICKFVYILQHHSLLLSEIVLQENEHFSKYK